MVQEGRCAVRPQNRFSSCCHMLVELVSCSVSQTLLFIPVANVGCFGLLLMGKAAITYPILPCSDSENQAEGESKLKALIERAESSDDEQTLLALKEAAQEVLEQLDKTE